jgi:WD40 repeat protein
MMHRTTAIKLALIVTLLSALTSLIPPPANAEGLEIRRFGNGSARAVAWRADDQQLAVGGSLGIWVYSTAGNDLKLAAHLTGNEGEITAMAWSPNGRQIVTANHSDTLQLWDVASGKAQVLQKATNDKVQEYSGSVSFSPDGTQFASASLDNAAYIWDSATGKRVMTLKTDGPVLGVAWHPKEARLAVSGVHADELMLLQVWDTKTGKLLNNYAPPEDYPPELSKGPTTLVQWTDGGTAVAALFSCYSVVAWIPGEDSVGSRDSDIGGTAQLGYSYSLDGKSTAVARQGLGGYGIHVHSETLGGDLNASAQPALAWSPDGRYLAAIGDALYVVDGSIVYNGPYESVPARKASDFPAVPGDVSWSQDGQHLLYAEQHPPFNYRGDDSLESFLVKDLATGESLWGWQREQFEQAGLGGIQLWVLRPDRNALVVVQHVEYCPDTGCSVTILQNDGSSSKLEEIPLTNTEFDPTGLRVLRWSPDGTHLAAHDGSEGLATWDAQTKKLLSTARIGEADDLQWSPGNHYLVALPSARYEELTAFVVDAETGKVLFPLEGINGATLDHVVWGPNGRSIAAISRDHVVRIWAVPSGKLLQTIPGHTIEWAGDGLHLAISTESQTVQVYDTGTGRVSMTLKAGASVSVTAFSPDNRRLATGGSDGTIQIWDVATGKVLLTLAGHVGPVASLSWKPDGSQLLSHGSDSTLRQWKAQG